MGQVELSSRTLTIRSGGADLLILASLEITTLAHDHYRPGAVISTLKEGQRMPAKNSSV